MTTHEYIQFILDAKKETSTPKPINETAANEAAQLISGSFTYLLYETLWMNDFDIEAITFHLESLYDMEEHFGLVYFIFILANAAEFTVPAKFTEMSATDSLAPCLSAAIIEDWLEYAAASEATETS